MRNFRRSGFTLIEALASAALLGVGITASMSALAAIAKTETRSRDVEMMQRLAFDKYDEMVATSQQPITGQSGDFTDHNIQGYSWVLDVAPSSTQNLDTVKVTVTKQGSSQNAPQGVAEGLIYIPPQTSTSTGTTP